MRAKASRNPTAPAISSQGLPCEAKTTPHTRIKPITSIASSAQINFTFEYALRRPYIQAAERSESEVFPNASQSPERGQLVPVCIPARLPVDVQEPGAPALVALGERV